MIFAILAVVVLLSAIAWSLFVQWRMQRRKLDESEREVADAISRHIKLLSAVAAVLVTKGSIALAAVMMLAACTKEGDTIYEWDPNEPKASTAPLVTVIYGQDALGDRSYNDLIYQGVEEAAAKYGLRTMQLSPTSYEEGRGYLQSMFQTVSQTLNDSVRRLFIVCAAGYDDYIRQNSHLFDSNPNADLLYLETPEPLAAGGSTLYLPYYGAMYEAGAIQPVFNESATLIISNPEDQTVVGAGKGFTDGFYTDYYRIEYDSLEQSWGFTWEKNLQTIYLAEHTGEGYNIDETTAFQVLNECEYTIIPICGGSGYTMMYLCEIASSHGYVGIDVENESCTMSILKHIDRAVGLCIGQWLSPEGMPKHQVLGLKEGYTGVALHLRDYRLEQYNKYIPETLRQQIHEDAVRKEEAYENN
jgi:basic membrane protein A